MTIYQGQRKQFNSGQAISQKGGSGGPPLEKCCLLVHFGTTWLINILEMGHLWLTKLSKYTKTVLTTTYEVICTVK